MAEERPGDPGAVLRSMLPGLAWTQSLVESSGRAQAAAAADALRRVNAPVLAALAQQREAAQALASLAAQMAAMAEQLGVAARQQEALTAQLEAAMAPYRSYVEWLEKAAGGGR
jgi:arginine/lysine/ornithine decarboxylase